MDKQPAKSTANSLIFEIRGQNVMLDSDLAKLYETDTKKLKQQVIVQRGKDDVQWNEFLERLNLS